MYGPGTFLKIFVFLGSVFLFRRRGEYGQLGHDQLIQEQPGGNEPDGDGELLPGRKVGRRPHVGLRQKDHIEAVEHHSEDDHAVRSQKRRDGGADALAGEQEHGKDHAHAHFQQKEAALRASLEHGRDVALDCEIGHPSQEVNQEGDGSSPGQTVQDPGLVFPVPHVGAHDGLAGDHGQAHAHRGEEEEVMDELGVPQRMKLGRGDQKQPAQGGLVPVGEHDPQNDQGEQHGALLQKVPHSGEHVEPFQQPGQKLQKEHQGVEGDADDDLEHDRPGLPEEDGVPDGKGFADIQEYPEDHQEIAQKGRQCGRSGNGLELVPVGHVRGEGHGKASRGQSNPSGYVKGDPEAPGGGVAQVGRRTQPHGQPVQGHNGSEYGQAEEYPRL